MRKPNDPDSFGILSAIWIMANRDEKPLMFYEDVAYRLNRNDVQYVKKLVSERTDLFRLGVTEKRLKEWREWRRDRFENGYVPPWITRKAEAEGKIIEKVIDEIRESEVFRSQFRVISKDDYKVQEGAKPKKGAVASQTSVDAPPRDAVASPVDVEIIEWGLEYLDRRRKSLLEAQKADLETLDVNIKKRQIVLVAVVGAISGIGVIANIVVNVLLK
jgi:hypothetical protein